MSINDDLVDGVRNKLLQELPEKYRYFVEEYDSYILKPNTRDAFLVLMNIKKSGIGNRARH